MQINSMFQFGISEGILESESITSHSLVTEHAVKRSVNFGTNPVLDTLGN